ncbi:dienelactone hydrolase family protein [Luteimicrobium sp. NPDC057192]|uniref:dienelactone hydrolase family protein n=1 Tax=Luteimicrobium sp. NPDC057192 TaxID=3346042 RepID=UPI003632322B
MRITDETVADGVREQLFMLGEIPGALWTPADAVGPRPLVLVGHGGGQHRKGWEVTSRAIPFVQQCGYAVAAIDAPGTGDRPEHPEVRRLVATIQAGEAAGEPRGPEWRALCDVVAEELVPDWATTLDALQQLDVVGSGGPVGYYGLSQGGEMGFRLVPAEPRITAAVLGLIGSEWLLEPASRITVPVELALQWDDEGNPRDAVLALYDALGSVEKTLHANPGGHFRVPMFEIDSAVRFFARHLGVAPVA